MEARERFDDGVVKIDARLRFIMVQNRVPIM